MDNPLTSSDKYGELGTLIHAISNGEFEEGEFVPSEQEIQLLRNVLDYFLYLKKKAEEEK